MSVFFLNYVLLKSLSDFWRKERFLYSFCLSVERHDDVLSFYC